jgi:DNA processing protein
MISHENKLFDLIAFQAPKFCWKWFEKEAKKAKSLAQAALASAEAEPVANELLERSASVLLREKAEKLIETCQAKNTEVITWSDSDYPAQLRALYRPPLALFARTSNASTENAPHEILSAPSAAVVGSRKADISGISIARQLSKALAERGVLVVSGLAVGIDAAAHRGALDARTPTVAVLGHGLNYLYPQSHEPLASQILEEGGILLSQFPPETAPLPGYFLERNRVIAGLSRAVVVVQATARSGSLATARFGLEEGREVLVVPGSIDDPRYEGSNALLKQGAGLVTGPEDILEYFPEYKAAQKVQDRSSTDRPENAIVSYLKEQGPTSLEDLRRAFSEDDELEIRLIDLELAGALQRLPGNVLAAA